MYIINIDKGLDLSVIRPSEETLTQEYQIHPYVSNFQGVCPYCAHRIYNTLPVEPVFDLHTAYQMLGFASLGNFHSYLSKPRVRGNLHPIKLYRPNQRHVIYRYLRAWEIQVLRDLQFRTRGESGKLRTLFDMYHRLTGDDLETASHPELTR